MMKHLFRHILTSMLAATALASCSDDSPVSPAAAPDAEVYFSIDLSLPSTSEGSRSSTKDDGTSSDGTLAATPEECAIKSMVLVFTSADDNKTLLHVNIGEDAIVTDGTDKTRRTASASMKLTDVTRALAGKNLNLYILANPLPVPLYDVNASPLRDLETGKFDPMTAKYDIEQFSDIQLGHYAEALPMSNAELYTISGLTADNLAEHINSSTPLLLNDYHAKKTPVLLERSVARIDYKDGSPTGDFTYQLGNSKYHAKVVELKLCTLSRAMYCFRHTSPDGSDDKKQLFGIEKKESGYVMDTDAADKRALKNLYMKGGIEVTGNETATDSKYVNAFCISYDERPDAGDGYRVLQYIPENTHPSIESQIQANTTALHFVVEVIDVPEDIKGKEQPITVEYDGGTWTVPYKGGAYLLDYYYFIQHNDNGLDGVMGVMEYGIVRNNVYRLSLLSIDGPPTPLVPEEPDEDPRLTLKVRVKKWGYHKIVFDM